MIARPTVFVLGAGASAPYGFPLGASLMDDIRVQLLREDEDGLRIRQDLLYAGNGKIAALKDFAKLIGEAGRESIDEVLQWHPEWKEVGKLAIARILIPCERDDRLDFTADERVWNRDERRRGMRWYRYLFNRLLTSRRGRCAVTENRLTVVTFNFDRSFERALFKFVRANCAATDAEARQQTAAIPVLHVHGQLGMPEWLSPAPGLPAREYAPNHTSVDYLRMCAEQIRIVDDEVLNSNTLAAARAALEAADTICFLGFSYHPLNLRKLGIETFKGKSVHGTAFETPLGPRQSVEMAFREVSQDGQVKINLLRREDHILCFLENTLVIHD